MTKAEYVKLLKADFRNFLFAIWKHLGLPKPTIRQYQVANFLQKGSKRRIVEAYRGFGKSWITSVYVLWKLFRNPDEKFLVISASGDRAKNFTTFTQRLIMSVPFLKPLIPPAYMRWSTMAFDVRGSKPSHAPSVKASGVFSQITGARATEIILDDVETINTVETETMRAKLYATLSEMENIIVPGGVITYLGTPHSIDSIYGAHKLLARGYEAYIVPARYPHVDHIQRYNGYLAPEIVQELKEDPELYWKPTDTRYTEEELNLRELGAGKSNFMMQYMLDTTESDEYKYPLKLRDLIVFETDKRKAPVGIRHTNDTEYKLDFYELGVSGADFLYAPSRIDEEWLEYQGIYMAIDPSGRGTDQTTYTIIGQLYGNLYVLDLGGFEGGYTDETLEKLAKKAKEYNVNKVFIEANFGDGIFTKIFQPILYSYHKCALEEVKQTKQKEKRIIDTLEPVFNQHRLIIDKQIVQHEYSEYFKESRQPYSLLYQLTHLTMEKDSIPHDDKIDVLAIGVQAWQQALGLDGEKLKERYKRERLMKYLEDFSARIGKTKQYNTMIDYDDERDWFDRL